MIRLAESMILGSCVEKIKVMPSCSLSSFMSSIKAIPFCVSKLAVGSSASTTWGLETMARATATLSAVRLRALLYFQPSA